MRGTRGRDLIAWTAIAATVLVGMPSAWADCAPDQVQVGDVCVLQAELARVSGAARCRATALEACRQACDAGDGGSCRVLATAIAQGRGGVPRDYDAARAVFERACELGDRDSCALLRPSVEFDDSTGEVDTGRLGRIALEVLSGITGAGITIGLTFLIGANVDGSGGADSETLIGVSMALASLAMAASVWGTGEALDGDGSFLLSLLGAGVGFGVASMLTFSDDNDVSEPFIWTLAVLPIMGTVAAYELSAATGYGVVFGEDREPVATAPPQSTMVGSVGTIPGDPSVVLGVAGTF